MTGYETKTRNLPPAGLPLVSHTEHQRLIEEGLDALHYERVRLIRLMTAGKSARRRRKAIAGLALLEQAAQGLIALDRRRDDAMLGLYNGGPGLEIQSREDARAHPA